MLKKVSHSVRKQFSWKLLIILGVLFLAVAGLELTGHIHLFSKTKNSPVIPSTTSAPKRSSTAKSDVSNSGPAGSTDKSTSAGTNLPAVGNSPSTTSNSQAMLIAPSGNFVSNHKPGQNGSPTSEQSVCDTTPGATCFIQFTRDSTVKILAPQVAGSDGTAFWEWDAKDASSIGLTPGSWNVSAVASLNGQTKTSNDALPLEIQ